MLLLQQPQNGVLHFSGGIVFGKVFAEVANLKADLFPLIGFFFTENLEDTIRGENAVFLIAFFSQPNSLCVGRGAVVILGCFRHGSLMFLAEIRQLHSDGKAILPSSI